MGSRGHRDPQLVSSAGLVSLELWLPALPLPPLGTFVAGCLGQALCQDGRGDCGMPGSSQLHTKETMKPGVVEDPKFKSILGNLAT